VAATSCFHWYTLVWKRQYRLCLVPGVSPLPRRSPSRMTDTLASAGSSALADIACGTMLTIRCTIRTTTAASATFTAMVPATTASMDSCVTA